MRRLAIVLALCALAACTREGYVIDARIDGLEGEISLVDMFDHVISSSPVENGKFRFEGVVDTPQLMYLNNGLGQKYPVDTPVLLENARIKVRGDVETYDIAVSGTVANKNMTEYIRRKKQLDEMDLGAYATLVKETFDDNYDNLLGSMLIPNLAPYVSSEELLACCEMLPDEFRGLTMFCVSMDYNKDAWASMSETAGLFGMNFCDTVAKGQEVEAFYGDRQQ